MTKNADVNTRLGYLHRNIRMLRKLKGKSQSEIADALHIHKETYAKYEYGKKVPSLMTIIALCEYHHIAIDAMVKHDLSEGLLGKVYFDSNNELSEVINTFQRLSASSQKQIMERVEMLLEREAALYHEYNLMKPAGSEKKQR